MKEWQPSKNFQDDHRDKSDADGDADHDADDHEGDEGAVVRCEYSFTDHHYQLSSMIIE